MDSSTADAIQHHACHLTCLIKSDHDFLSDCEFNILMTLLYNVIDKVDDFIDV